MVQHSKRYLLQNLRKLTSDFFLPRDEMTSLWECQWTKLHCHFRIKVLGHKANSSDIFWVGASWSALGLKWPQVPLLFVCHGCVFNIQEDKEWTLTDKIWQINICLIRYFSVCTQSTAFLHIEIISNVGAGLLPKVIWWTARQKLFRRDRFFCMVGDTEKDWVNPANTLYKWKQRGKTSHSCSHAHGTAVGWHHGTAALTKPSKHISVWGPWHHCSNRHSHCVFWYVLDMPSPTETQHCGGI